MENNEELLSYLDNNSKAIWNSIVDRNYMHWDNSSKMHGSMNQGFLELFSRYNPKTELMKEFDISEQYYYEVAILSRYLAYRERTKILSSLCDYTTVDFFTNDRHLEDIRKEIIVHPGISYSDFELYKIYNKSKLNINISLHCIESGLSQRIYDVMAAEGFMISNYQEEIEDQFEIDKELVVYHNEEELYDKVKYYLNHDDKRKKIAICGQQKIFEQHGYENRIQRIMNILTDKESSRRKDYLRICEEFGQSIENANSITEMLNILANRDDAYSVLVYLKLNYPENSEVKLYIANYMLENGRYAQSLKELKKIENPSDEIQSLIDELDKIVM